MIKSKYHNRRIHNTYGDFDSKHEFEQYLLLLQLRRCGKVTELHRQVEFELIPTQSHTEIKQLKTKQKEVTVIDEKSCCYIADFTYKDEEGNLVVVDAKSEITRNNPVYIIKRKLMLYVHGIKIKEV